ncbi:MAG: hypothetical protein CMH83_13420 [Nocardioides sp.]|nr:hypothetical protein [Nocardioides sp.]
MTPTRRGLLLAGGSGVVAGCGTTDGAAPGTRDATATAAASAIGPAIGPATPTEPTAALPDPEPWQPVGDEVEPDAKLAAARAVEELGAGGGRVTRVVYPQYGGLLDSSACVMVVAVESRRSGDRVRRRRLVADVRLRRRSGRWRVVSVDRAPTARAAQVRGPAAQVVGRPRIDLSGAALADLRDGRVDPLVVDVLDRLAEEVRLSVSVLASGHPRMVFGTDSVSNHTRGRAVDVWALDGTPVAELPLDSPLLLRVLTRAAELGSDEVGGPVVPPVTSGVHFANPLHRDHVHVGFDV